MHKTQQKDQIDVWNLVRPPGLTTPPPSVATFMVDIHNVHIYILSTKCTFSRLVLYTEKQNMEYKRIERPHHHHPFTLYDFSVVLSIIIIKITII